MVIFFVLSRIALPRIALFWLNVRGQFRTISPPPKS
jgi:hypothetical protein